MASMKKNLITGSLFVGSLLAPAMMLADDAAAPAATPTPMAWYQKVTVGGYIDEYYQHSFNNPTAQAPNLVDRAYDGSANQFTFGGGELTLKQNDAASGTGYYVDLLLGNMAAVYNGSNDGAFTGSLNGTVGVHGHTFGSLIGTASGSVSNPDQVAIGQAYVTQAFGPLTATLGKFGTPIGYEVTYLPSNANFSRSLLYTQEPTFNTGLRLDYALPAGITLSGFIDDGNSTDGTITRGKDYGAVVAYSGVKDLNLTGVWYLNNGISVNGALEDIEWGNFIASYSVMDNLSFAGEYLVKEYNATQIGGPYNPIQQGYALYATYSPIANLSISPRFEAWANPTLGGVFAQYINNGDLVISGFVNTPTVLNDYTLTAKYQMGPLAHILEYRVDASNLSDAPFVTSNSSDNFNFLSNIQQTLTYAAVYSF